MGALSITAQVQAEKEAQGGKAALWIIAAAIAAAATLWGLSVGHWYMLVGFWAIAYAASHARAAGQTSAPRSVGVTLNAEGGVLNVALSASKLYSGRYVDQCFSCALADVDGAGVDASGVYRIRAKRMQGYLIDAGSILGSQTFDHAEVTFKADSASYAAVTNFLTQAGTRATGVVA